MPLPIPPIADLVGKDARLLFKGGRPGLQKRIVELDGRTYVLQRFGRRAAMQAFADTVERLRQSGIPVQDVLARAETLRHGNWVVLSYLPGALIDKAAGKKAFAALGTVMARLNALEGGPYRALFDRKQPKLPHAAYLRRHARTLSPEQRRWIEGSAARLSALPGTQLTHGDLHSKNIILLEDGSVGLIDYEMLAYDLSGIELAGTFMRPFCRRRANRSALLDAYLAACPAPLKEIWRAHAADLLFAAAARMALGREDKVRLTRFRDRIAACRQLLPFGRAAMARQRQAYAELLEATERRRVSYLHISRAVVDLSLAEPGMEPITLLERAEAG